MARRIKAGGYFKIVGKVGRWGVRSVKQRSGISIDSQSKTTSAINLKFSNNNSPV